jgi:hypothetical protein
MPNGSDMQDEFSVIAGDREFHAEFGEVPKSKGVPRSLLIAVGIGIVMIFLIGAGVVLNSSYGHHWPWNKNLTEPLK